MTHSLDYYETIDVRRKSGPRTLEEHLSDMRFSGGAIDPEDARRRKAAMERWIDSLHAR